MPSQRKLLVVDDDRLVLAMLSKGLKHANYEVVTACSGEQALNELENFSPDLAILDIGMPGVSGLDVARKLRSETTIPFLFLTAYGDHETVKEATASGAVGYLVKPVDTAQLIPAIEAGLARAGEIHTLQRSEEQLNQALNSSREISVAVGIIMERTRLDHEDAFQALRAQARSKRLPVHDLARTLIEAHETLNQFNSGNH
jgi:response regulator NasT